MTLTAPKPTGAASERRVSAARLSAFTPIAEYALLSDCHTGALVAPDGSIDWLCVPAFDSPSVFGSLLDKEAGTFRLGPFGISAPSDRHYEPGTNVLVTTWRTPKGWVEVRDALVIGRVRRHDVVTPHSRPPSDDDAEHVLVRTVTGLGGEVEIELICEPAFEYGAVAPEWAIRDDDALVADMSSPRLTMRLRTDFPMGIEGNRVRARRVLKAGDTAFCSLAWSADLAAPATSEDAKTAVEHTSRYWRAWLDGARIPDHRWAAAMQRSALTIKALTYMPTGATVAAQTTTLPETPAGERNWDYRYSWIRDSTFTLRALHLLNLDWEANDYVQFVADLGANEDGALQIMYGIDGRRDLPETTLDHLSGYDGARPVRVGNGAYDQRQNDVFGAVLDSLLLHSRRSQRLPSRLWPIARDQARCALKIWRQPDQGIWEARGEPKHYVSSKVMCWVALDRASELAAMMGESELQDEWAAAAEEIRADILEHGLDGNGVLKQHYDAPAGTLDASNLLAAILGFLPGTDPRLHASVLAIANDLTEDGFVLRYKVEETDDGMSGKEGSFLICSFWLVSALVVVGEEEMARDLFERLLRVASPLGLYAEEYDVATGYHLGNFPQAFSHLALVEAAGRIILAERERELR